jgi:hypothetical protein
MSHAPTFVRVLPEKSVVKIADKLVPAPVSAEK